MSGSNETPRKRPWKSSLTLRLAFLAIAASIAVPPLAILALHIPAVQKEIIPLAANRIESATRYKVELESYTWRPFSSLHLDNLKVLTEGRKILDCEKVRFSYSLTPNRPYVNPEEIYLEKPYLQLERNAEGKWVLPLKTASTSGGDPLWLRFPLPTLRIVSGTVEGRQQGRVVLSIKDITGVLRLKTFRGPGGPEIRIDLEDLQARADFLGAGTWVCLQGCIAGNKECEKSGQVL